MKHYSASKRIEDLNFQAVDWFLEKIMANYFCCYFFFQVRIGQKCQQK